MQEVGTKVDLTVGQGVVCQLKNKRKLQFDTENKYLSLETRIKGRF